MNGRGTERRGPRGLSVGLLAAALALLAPSSASALSSAPTGILCTTYHAQAGTATVRFGYSNISANTTEFEDNVAGSNANLFSPPPGDRRQPSQFVTGNGSFDLTQAAGAPALTWTLNGLTATAEFAAAELPFQRPCPERGPSIGAVAPAGVAAGGVARTLTVFGQGLAGASVAVSGSGVSVGSPTLTTSQRLDATVTVAAGAAPGPRDVLVTAANGDEVGCRGCLLVEPAAAPIVGPPGPQGPAGERGPAGPAGAASVSNASGRAVALARGGTTRAEARCPAGSAAISGGYEVTGRGAPALSVLANRAEGTAGWTVSVRARGARRGQRLRASVSCLAR